MTHLLEQEPVPQRLTRAEYMVIVQNRVPNGERWRLERLDLPEGERLCSVLRLNGMDDYPIVKFYAHPTLIEHATAGMLAGAVLDTDE